MTLEMMPTEILLEIFDCIGPDINKKLLMQTCERFEQIFAADFKLVLDFNRIHAGEIPEIWRKYREIVITGEEVSPFHLDEILSSSSDSCEDLKIGNDPLRNNDTLRIYSRVLFKLLEQLPSLKTLTMKNVNVIAPKCKFDAITDDEVPKLPMLSVLKIQSVDEPAFRGFTKSTEIEEITVEFQSAQTHKLHGSMSKLYGDAESSDEIEEAQKRPLQHFFQASRVICPATSRGTAAFKRVGSLHAGQKKFQLFNRRVAK